jgi:hypothetical protein
MEFDLTNPNIIGLALDILGVMTIGYSIISMSPIDIKLSGGTFWDCATPKIKETVNLRHDPLIGSILLFVGFVFQFLGTIKISIPTWLTIIFFIIAVLSLIFYASFIRVFLCKRWLKTHLNETAVELAINGKSA